MHIKKVLGITLVQFILIFSNCSATELSGEGYGKTLEFARKQALASLSEAISVEVKSEFNSTLTGKGEESSSSQIRSQSNLPILGASIDSYQKSTEYYCQAKLTSKELGLYRHQIQATLNKIKQIKNQLNAPSSDKQQKYILLTQALTELDQLSKYQTVAFVLGDTKTETPVLTSAFIQSQLISLGSEADSLDFAAKILAQKIEQQKIMLSPATLSGSHEITPMSRVLRDKLASYLNTTDQHEDAQYFFKGHYDILQRGIHVTYQLTDTKGNSNATRTVKITPEAYKNLAYQPRTTDFDRLLHQGIVVSNDFKVSINTNRGNENLLFTEGEEVELFIKLNRSGYFYIVSHVNNEEENESTESYLLELQNAPAPRKFIQFVNADDANRWISIGKFVVSEPYGIESLQIIASNNDLSGKLPPFKYNSKNELYMVSDGKLNDAVIQTRGLRPKKSKAKNILSSESVLMMTTFKK